MIENHSDCRQNAFGQHSRSVFLVLGSKSVYLINNKHFWVPLFPFLAIIFASFFTQYMQILSNAYNDASKADFYNFVRSLDSAKASLKNGNNTLILDKSSPITQVFYGY